MQPQSGRNLAPQQSRGITQTMEVWHAHDRTNRVETIKLRWRISCRLGDETKTDMGEVPEFGLA